MTGNVARAYWSSGIYLGNGGGIYNQGANATLTITNSLVSSNIAGMPASQPRGYDSGISNLGTAAHTNKNHSFGPPLMPSGAGYGGGIDNGNGAMMTISATMLSGNSATFGGGALSGDGTITNCTISGNQSWGGVGGGIAGDPIVTNCTISSNQAWVYGGGIYGSPTITNCTISGNSINGFGGGGGIYGGGIVRHSTMAGNTGSPGGGILATGPLEIGDTIFKTGASGANIALNGGTVTSHGYNISDDNGSGFLTGPGDQINTDPILGPLQDNGGPTFTHDLLPGSPAINAGDPNFTPPPFTDQRGYVRVYNGRIDIGSVEMQPTPVIISGTISYCSNPASPPVPNVTLTLTGTASGSTLSDSSGNYMFFVPSGGSYTVTPSKAPLAPASNGIDTVDVVAVQRHFLQIGAPLTGCRLIAADVNGDSAINTVDVAAIQRFVLVLSTGTANVGNYHFTPTNRTYQSIVTNQTNQNYDTLVFGDVASPYVH